jgi:hypothetical protein
LRNELRAAFQDDVLVAGSAAAEHLDTAVVRRVWTEHQAGSVNHGYTLWAIWVLSTWAASVRDRKPRSLVHADLPRVG